MRTAKWSATASTGMRSRTRLWTATRPALSTRTRASTPSTPGAATSRVNWPRARRAKTTRKSCPRLTTPIPRRWSSRPASWVPRPA